MCNEAYFGLAWKFFKFTTLSLILYHTFKNRLKKADLKALGAICFLVKSRLGPVLTHKIFLLYAAAAGGVQSCPSIYGKVFHYYYSHRDCSMVHTQYCMRKMNLNPKMFFCLCKLFHGSKASAAGDPLIAQALTA